MIRTLTDIQITSTHQDNPDSHVWLYELALTLLPIVVSETLGLEVLYVSTLDLAVQIQGRDCNYLAMNSQQYLEWRHEPGVDILLELVHLERTLDHVVGGYRQPGGALTVILANPEVPRNILLGSSNTDDTVFIIHLMTQDPQ